MPTAKNGPASRRIPAAAAAPAPRRNPNRQQSLAKTHQEDDEENKDEDEDSDDGDEMGGENMVDMLSILQEYQKKKSSKLSSHTAALEAKKKTIRDAAYAQVKEMKTAAAAYIENVKVEIEMLEEQEMSPDAEFADLAALLGHRAKGVIAHLEVLTQHLTELSPARVEIIEESSTSLHSHTERFAATRKHAMKKARRDLHSGMEQQKLATDAQAYIKHYKHLVQI